MTSPGVITNTQSACSSVEPRWTREMGFKTWPWGSEGLVHSYLQIYVNVYTHRHTHTHTVHGNTFHQIMPKNVENCSLEELYTGVYTDQVAQSFYKQAAPMPIKLLRNAMWKMRSRPSSNMCFIKYSKFWFWNSCHNMWMIHVPQTFSTTLLLY